MTSTPSDLWTDYLAAHPEFADQPTPPTDQFGYSPEMCDERLDLVLAGQKRTIADLLIDYGMSVRGMPGPGDHWLAADGRGVPQVVLRTVAARIGTLSTTDEEFAYDYAEGATRTAAAWIEDHRGLFAENLPDDTEGVELEPIVFERFAVVWPQERVTDDDRERIAEVERFIA